MRTWVENLPDTKELGLEWFCPAYDKQTEYVPKSRLGVFC